MMDRDYYYGSESSELRQAALPGAAAREGGAEQAAAARGGTTGSGAGGPAEGLARRPAAACGSAGPAHDHDERLRLNAPSFVAAGPQPQPPCPATTPKGPPKGASKGKKGKKGKHVAAQALPLTAAALAAAPPARQKVMIGELLLPA
eukprot:4006016-Lingulodinium_polyedra.AAC.1